MKDQYHTFENEGRKAEVLTEDSAEKLSDEWVMGDLKIV